MYEKRDLQNVREGLGCITTRTDPKRQLYVSGLPDKPSPVSRITETIEAAVNIMASGMFLSAGIGMLYLVIRMMEIM